MHCRCARTADKIGVRVIPNADFHIASRSLLRRHERPMRVHDFPTPG
nr:MAG TPA: hypothetical protein [Caudoviricetes sp.]